MMIEPSDAARKAAAEKMAQAFHETYERLAPSFGYKTRADSAKPWADVPQQNKDLMIGVCYELRTAPTETIEPNEAQSRSLHKALVASFDEFEAPTEDEIEARVAELEDENLRLIACGKEMIMGNRRARSRATAAEAALAELEANAIRSEQHRNDLYDKIVLQTTEIGALKAALADERARVVEEAARIANRYCLSDHYSFDETTLAENVARAIRALATVKEAGE